MGLTHAPFCSQCNARRTNHPSGICSRCQRSRRRKPCVSCGEVNTDHPSGQCSRCRSARTGLNRLDKTIEHYEKTLRALKLLRENTSFQNIADILGMSKSGTYTMCQSALRSPFYIAPEEEEVS